MAFGYSRLPGRSRNYVNNETGEIISRRQYDKRIAAEGKRQPALRTSIEAIRDTERALEALRDQLSRREAELATRETLLAEREALVAEREREAALEKQLVRASAQGAGQRRYNAALEAYVRSQRLRGRRMSKREARDDPRFKQILSDLKGKPNKRKSPIIADQNRFIRRKALDQLGGDEFFRDQYQSLYGSAGGHGHNRHRIVRRQAPSGRRAA